MGTPLLLVHDDLATIALVRRTLIRAGHTVELATTTADALAAATNLAPALVLLAPAVESGRGTALVDELRGGASTAHLPILLLGRAVDGHALPLLTPPYRVETLLRAVEEALEPPVVDPSAVTNVMEAGPGEPETMDLDWTPGPRASITAELQTVPLPRFGAPPSDASEPFDAGPLLEAAPDVDAAASGDMGPVVGEEPDRFQGSPGVTAADDAPVLEGYEQTGSFVLASPETPLPGPAHAPAPRDGGGLSEFARALEEPGAPSGSLDDAMVALAAGAWTAATDDRLESTPPSGLPAEPVSVAPEESFAELASPSGAPWDLAPGPAAEEVADGAGRDSADGLADLASFDAPQAPSDGGAESLGSAAALLEDIAAEARAREDEARAARDSAVEEQRRRLEAEADAEAKAREARESSAAARAARIDLEEARAQTEAARAAQEAAEAARLRAEAALEERRLAEEDERRLRAEAEARATAEARRLAAEAREAQAQAEVERRRAEEAQAAVQAAQATGAAEAELLAQTLRDEATRRAAELDEETRRRQEAEARALAEAAARAEAEQRAVAELAALAERARALEQEVAQARAEAESRAAREREAAQSALAATELAQSLEREASELAERLASEERAAMDAQARAEAAIQAERAAADALRRELATARAEARRSAEELAAVRARAEAAESRALDGEAAGLRARAEADAERERARVAAEAERERLRAEAEADRERLRLEVEAREAEARAREEAAAQARDAADRARADAEARLRELQTRAEEEARALAEAEAAEVARRAAERARWAVADAGRVTLPELAALLVKLDEGRATARLELRAADALRVVWLEEGVVQAVASTVSTESLLDHCLRDGLLDVAAERELRILRLSEAELLETLARRDLVPERELVPFLQRVAESRALEAFSEPVSFYRLSPDTPPPEGRRAAVRSLSALAAEGVRRGLPAEEVEERVPSMRAAPRLLRRVDGAALGLSERDQRLLDVVDGRRTVNEVLLAAGVPRDAGRRALAVAAVLGWLELLPPNEDDARAESAEAAMARLEARWTQVEDADYFTVLGLPRHAGSDEVARAFARLSAEYDPLRWSGHPDPRVQDRAERMQALLAEAARALSDDGLRSAYARSLGE